MGIIVDLVCIGEKLMDKTGKPSVLKSKEIIVSMTSYPPRIHSAVLALKTIFKQTKLPDKVILFDKILSK